MGIPEGYGTGADGRDALISGFHRGYRKWNLVSANAEWSRTDDLATPADYRARSVSVRDTYSPLRLGLGAIGIPMFVWRPGPNKAGCYRGEFHPKGSPGKHCACGFYSAHTPDGLRGIVGAFFGSIRITGRVVLGTKGSRAQHAQIEAIAPAGDSSLLYWSDGKDVTIRIIGERYGIPVFDSLSELLALYPPLDTTELLLDEESLLEKSNDDTRP